MRPTIGRIVLIVLAIGIVPAIVTATYDDGAVDATVFMPGAAPQPWTRVPHDPTERHIGSWHWMDYQKGQAAKAEALESALAAQKPATWGRMIGAIDHGMTTRESLAASVGLRRIMGHESNPCNSKIVIVADGPGPGGASHEYRVRIGATSEVSEAADVQTVRFQNGPVLEDGNGVNGTTHEVLLTIVADRLQGFQDGPYACPENAAALEAVGLALSILHQRTQRREARGVEGTHEV